MSGPDETLVRVHKAPSHLKLSILGDICWYCFHKSCIFKTFFVIEFLFLVFVFISFVANLIVL